MINNKLLLSIVIISIAYTGCNEKESEIKNTVVTEKKIEVKQEKVQESKLEEVSVVIKKETIIAPVIKEVKKITSKPNATALFKKCIGCHGQNAEKKALNKSAIIKDWDTTKIANALKGYRDGTYGGAMKGLMKSQVATMSDEDIDLLSQHISNFK